MGRLWWMHRLCVKHSDSIEGIATPFLPQATRRQIDAAARIVVRARLGDVTAKQFIRNVVNAANAGIHAEVALRIAHFRRHDKINIHSALAATPPKRRGTSL